MEASALLPRGARKKLLFTNMDLNSDITIRAKSILQQPQDHLTPGIDQIEEDLRTLPPCIRDPWDILRGPKYDVCHPRHAARLQRQGRQNRFNWRAPRCTTASKAREIGRPGLPADPLRSAEESYGGGWLSEERLASIADDTYMMTSSFKACTEDAREGRGTAYEHPWDAYSWDMDEADEFGECEGVFDVLFHNCMHGGERRKGSRVRTNIEELKALEILCADIRICSRTGRPHAPWWTPGQRTRDSVQHATEEAEYPYGLCMAIAWCWIMTGAFKRYKGQFLFMEVDQGPP